MRTQNHHNNSNITDINSSGHTSNFRNSPKVPTDSELKSQIGHGELGLIEGKWKRSCLVLYVDRASKYLKLMRVDQFNTSSITEAIKSGLSSIAPHILSITAVNRKEFADHEEFSKHLGCNFFYSNQFSKPQLGLCSNTISLINQFFPKKTDFLQISDCEVNQVEGKLNLRPRKTLNWLNPYEIFNYACGLVPQEYLNTEKIVKNIPKSIHLNPSILSENK